MNRVKDNILATLAYFDLFRYPLTGNEIYLFMKQRITSAVVDGALKHLVTEQAIYQFGNYYSLHNNPDLILRRYKGNKLAAGMIESAHRLSQILICVPYVRGIAISGSVSKKYAEENSDIDLFIIAAKNRLWIARALLNVIINIIALVNKRFNLALEYCIDDAMLEIKEKNMHTAIEVVTLIPLQGDTVMHRFYAANRWVRSYLPNNVMRLSSARPFKALLFKTMFERVLNNSLGTFINNKLLQYAVYRWHKKAVETGANAKGAGMAMLASRHQARPNPRNFQTRLLAQYENKISEMQIAPQNLLAN